MDGSERPNSKRHLECRLLLGTSFFHPGLYVSLVPTRQVTKESNPLTHVVENGLEVLLVLLALSFAFGLFGLLLEDFGFLRLLLGGLLLGFLLCLGERGSFARS